MVVTSGIERAIQYFHAIEAYLRERKSPYRAVVAFSGEHDVPRLLDDLVRSHVVIACAAPNPAGQLM